MKKKIIKIRVAGIVVKNDTILLVKHRKNNKEYWLLPGGGIEYGETATEALIREFREETGLKILPLQFLFTNESIPEDKHRHIVNIYFECKIISGTLKRVVEKVLKDSAFIPIKDLKKLIFYPDVKSEVLRFIKHKKISDRYLGNLWK